MKRTQLFDRLAAAAYGRRNEATSEAQFTYWRGVADALNTCGSLADETDEAVLRYMADHPGSVLDDINGVGK